MEVIMRPLPTLMMIPLLFGAAFPGGGCATMEAGTGRQQISGYVTIRNLNHVIYSNRQDYVDGNARCTTIASRRHINISEGNVQHFSVLRRIVIDETMLDGTIVVHRFQGRILNSSCHTSEVLIVRVKRGI